MPPFITQNKKGLQNQMFNENNIKKINNISSDIKKGGNKNVLNVADNKLNFSQKEISEKLNIPISGIEKNMNASGYSCKREK